MSISSLHIFAKNTDATAALKGYQYQILKTLETWLQNKVTEKDETVYCDYEEDIYQQDDFLHSAKFRQLKLYSTNFSFADDEVKKAIAHFFMLYVKGEYTYDDLEFIFETNASIKNEARGNQANLLKEWFENQENPSDHLLERASSLVKDLLTKYVTAESAKPSTADKPFIQKAIADFQKLTDDDFKSFTRKIRWDFQNIDPDDALEATISNIKSLIEALPYPTAKENVTILIGRLHYEILERATKKEISEKALNNALLDSIVLKIGTEEDKLYEQVYQTWLADPNIQAFITGEFFEVIHASEFCRYREFLKAHDELWKGILMQYVNLQKIPRKFKRAAIYEICLLSLRNNLETYVPAGTLKGTEDLVREYYAVFDFETSELRDALTLLMMVTSSYYLKLIDCTEEETKIWHLSFKNMLEQKLETAASASEKCEILAVFGQFAYLIDHKNLAVAKSYYDPIPGLLEDADQFNVSQFYDTLNQFIQATLKAKPDNFQDIVDAFEDILTKVEPWVIKREGNFKIARRLIEKGALYIAEGNIKYYLKALDAFQQAKEFYRVGEYMAGYVLALINIAKVYSDAGLLFAAKYYALCAIWVVFQKDDPDLYSRLPDAMLLLLMADFKQGAWLAVFDDLDLYLNFHIEFANTSGSVFEESRLEMVFYTVAVVFAFVPMIKPELQTHVEQRAKSLGQLYENRLSELVESLKVSLPGEKIEDVIFNNIVIDQPLNDLGEKRTVSWYAFGIKWEINFRNDFETNAAGEEFYALLQITHAELAIQNFDFHFMQAPVRINIVISDQQSMPVQEPSNQTSAWKIYIPELKGNDSRSIQELYTRMLGNIAVVLQEISFLKPQEFIELWKKFIEDRKIHAKSLVENGYQRIYKEVFDKTRFEEVDRKAHTPVGSLTQFPKENPNLNPKTEVSSKYDQQRSLENISNRYKNTTKQIHLTLDHYKDDIEFNLWIADLREKGWRDWQITIGLMNLIVAYKANVLVQTRSYKTEKQKKEAFENLVKKSLSGKEDDNFKIVSVEYLKSEMEFELNMFSVRFMESLGLQFKAKFPNFEAVKNFIKNRLNFSSDDVPELSPLKDFGMNSVSRNTVQFEFAKTDNESPAVYYFQLSDNGQAWNLINGIKEKLGDEQVNISITATGENLANITIFNEIGQEFSISDIKIAPDLKTRMDRYYDGKAKSCVLACSTEMSELGTPILITPQKLISVMSVLIE